MQSSASIALQPKTTLTNNVNEKESNNSESMNGVVNTGTIPGSLKNVSDRVLKAKAKLIDSPYDLDAWNILIKDVQVGQKSDSLK